MNRLFGLALIVVTSQVAWGQQSAPDTARVTNVKRYPDHLFIWPVIKQRSLNFEVQKRNDDKDFLSFKPNSTVSMGVGLYVFEVGVELALAVPIDEKSRAQYGTSDVHDLQGQIVGRGLALDFFTQRYSGFYLSNPSSIRKNDPYPQRPDLTLKNTGVSGLYVFNRKKMSLKSAFNFAERQLRSGGSWVLAGTFNSVRLFSDSTLVGPALQRRLKLDKTFDDIHYTTLSLAPGYAYNLIYKNWFVNLTLSVGPAHHWVSFNDAAGKPHYDIAINSFVDSRLALGYNSDRWFGGVGFINQAREVRFADFQFTTTTTSFKMLVGYRILEKGIFKKRAIDYVPVFGPKGITSLGSRSSR